jgi:exosortase A-associated hydrolase 1
MHEERALSFACAGERLFGILSLPAPTSTQAPATRGVLIVVGGPQYRAGSHRQFTLLARSLADAGIPCLRFDYRGMGDSEGGMRDFEAVETDLRAALDALFAELPQLRDVALLGLCDGAAAAVLYAGRDPRVRGLALLNPWVRTAAGAARATVKHYYAGRLADAGFWRKLAGGRLDWRAAARSALVNLRAMLGPRSGAESLPERLHAGLRRFDGRLLLILSGADLTAQEFADLAGTPKWRRLLRGRQVTRHDLAGADHTFSRRAWHDAVTAWTRDWMRAW